MVTMIVCLLPFVVVSLLCWRDPAHLATAAQKTETNYQYMNAGQQMAWLNGYWSPSEVIETENGVLYR